MERANLILDHVLDERSLEVLYQSPRRILIDRAHDVPPAVVSLKVQRHGLTKSSGPEWGEASADLAEVQDVCLYRGGPQVAIIASQKEPLEPAGLVTGAGNYEAATPP